VENWALEHVLPDKLCNKHNDAMGTLHQNRKGDPAEIKKVKLKENVKM
jgi:hypothetical protein